MEIDGTRINDHENIWKIDCDPQDMGNVLKSMQYMKDAKMQNTLEYTSQPRAKY